MNSQSLAIAFTNSNTVPSPTKHTTNQNIRGISYDKFPKDKNKIQTKHIRTNAIEETESSDPESSEEG